MKLPTGFSYSQSNLQDFYDCPKRFLLQHIQRIQWPALVSEPVLEREMHMQRGQLFHQMAHQYLIGLDAATLVGQTSDPVIHKWWDNLLSSGILETLPEIRHPEYTISAPFESQRIIAKYDLVAVQPGEKAVILDWKTSLNKPSRRRLLERIQTRLYPCLLVMAGAGINGGQVFQPEQIEMVYWFSEYPDQPVRLIYTTNQYQADLLFLTTLAKQIMQNQESEFNLTANEKTCDFCIYRSLCNRGDKAGNWEEEEGVGDDLQSLDIDFTQIGEIEF